MVLKGWGTFGVCLVSPPTHYLPNTWVDEKKIGRLVDCDPHYLLVAYRCSRGNCVQLAPMLVPPPVPTPPTKLYRVNYYNHSNNMSDSTGMVYNTE